MSERSSLPVMTLRAAALLAIFVLPFVCVGALNFWPDSDYSWIWQILLSAYGAVAIAAFVRRLFGSKRHDTDSLESSTGLGKSDEAP